MTKRKTIPQPVDFIESLWVWFDDMHTSSCITYGGYYDHIAKKMICDCWVGLQVKNITEVHSYWVEKELQQLVSRRDKRLHCPTCWERKDGRLGAAVITSWGCRKCQGHQMSGSSNHDALCLGCSLIYKLCIQCGYNPNQLPKITMETL